MQVGKSLVNKLKFTAQQIQADASEWLVHEQRLVVTKSQLAHFNQQVTDTEKQVELLIKRSGQLLNNKIELSNSTQKDSCE